MNSKPFIFSIFLTLLLIPATGFAGGSREEEVTADQAATLKEQAQNEVLARTVRKPGPPEYSIGSYGGTYVTTINNDPKSFNDLTARDADTSTVVNMFSDALLDYDVYKREWKANLADYEIQVDEENDKLDVILTLRDDVYWTTASGTTQEKVTSDDVVFWYDEIQGDPALQQPGYAQQFVTMPDGTEERVTIEKIDDRRFVFHFPRIVASPELSVNMNFGPRYIYEPAKRRDGTEGVLNVLSIDTNPRNVPSIGEYVLHEYSPGVRLVFKRNPNYWKTDDEGNRLPYIETLNMRIVPDFNTEFLLFKEGTKDAWTARPEDLDELLSTSNPDYTVYNAGASLGSLFVTFNQNPDTVRSPKYDWFTQKEFRQAMSSLLNRERIARQVYRGLAEPALGLFPEINPVYNPDIKLQYTYNPQQAIELLESIGITRRSDGKMYDSNGNHVTFDLMLGAENNTGIDMMNIFADELKNVGITMNVRPVDFQKLVESITTTYDWDAVLVGLGTYVFPEQGSNVWQSTGNFHLWHPLQEQPATEWEARIDKLYNEGLFTIDEEERQALYDEYQRLILEELPLMYIVHQYSFTAIRDKWENVYVDNLASPDTAYFYLKNQ